MGATRSDVDEVLHQLGFAIVAPLVRHNVETAVAFFNQRMPRLDDATRLGFLRGMDLHTRVARITLGPGQVLAAFRRPHEPAFKTFYTKAGTAVSQVGVRPVDRRFRRFRVTRSVEVLESRAAGVADTWTVPGDPYLATGGGWQYVVPDADTCLALVT